jgi:hypothetical protein
MCYFLTVAVPESGTASLEEAVPRGLALLPLANASITRHLPKKWRQFALTSGMCSCDLFHGSLADRSQESHAETLRRKYKKEGWSETKIRRALAQADRALRVQALKGPADFQGLRPDLRDLLARVVNDTGELAIVVHFYGGSIETEKFPVQKGPLVPPGALRAGDSVLGEDQLFLVRRKGRLPGLPE